MILHNFPTYIKKPSAFTFDEVDMNLSTISFTVVLDAKINPDFKLDWAVEFRGRMFTLQTLLPSGIKDNTSMQYKYDLIFKSEEVELSYYPFLNMVSLDSGDKLPNQSTFAFQGNVMEFINRFNLNLQYYLGNKWGMAYVGGGDVSTTTKTVSVDNSSLWDMLTQLYDLYGIRWSINGHMIEVGALAEEVEHVFEYGSENGLYSIQRTNPNDNIYTRLIGQGGDRNMPLTYFKTDDPDTNNIIKSMHFTGIMPKGYRDYIRGWNAGVLDSAETSEYNQGATDKTDGKKMQPINYVERNIEKWGIRYGSIQPNPNIYPTIQGMERAGLGRVDEIIDVESVTEDDPESGDFSDYFNVWIKDIGFDLRDSKHWVTERMKMMFSDGMLAGEDYEFELVAEELNDGSLEPHIYPDTSRSHNGVQSAWRIQLLKSDAELQASGRYLPNRMQNAKAGDHFFLINISLPHEYVLQAEQRVTNWLNEEITNTSDEFPTYTIKPSAIFMEDFIESDKMKAGAKIRIADERLVGDSYLPIYIQSMRLDYRDGKMLPNIEITVSDKVVASRNPIELLQSAVQSLSSGAYSIQQTAELARQFERFFIRKDIPDIAKMIITFMQGINIGKFTSGSSGSGGTFKMQDGVSVIEVDKLMVRMMTEGHIMFRDGFTSKSHSHIEAPLDVDKKITAKGGVQFGETFAGGLTGHGGFIDGHGNAQLRSLILQTFLEVPELRFNRIDVIAGDLWNTKGAGIIEEVDTVNQIITLKLEKGDIGRFRYDDIVMGIFHSFNDNDNSVDSYDDGIGNRRYSGFATSYFRVTQILDAEYYSKFRYELRPISPRHPKQFHPQPFMTSAAYGNFTNAERQTSMYQTTSYIRLLRNVNNWEFGIENIGMQWGDLSNLSIFGLDMTGYSAYMENVYFSGIIHQLSAKIKEQLDAQKVGGKNLLREYDIRFGFKYWGNAGEYTEFDINQIESTPQLQVQPNILNWTFPIRYGTIVITANGVWNITTPNWLNTYPAAGSGNKNVDLKANEYKGRNARVGTVAVQSGVIQRNVSISQAGLAEFVTIDPILNIGYEAQTVTITGKSNSRKLTFSVDTGYLEINLPAQYKVNGTNVNNGSLIAGDPGALDEYSFSITVAVGENVEEFSIQNNTFATAEGGQKAISTIVQRRTRIKVLADADNSVISIGDMIFHIN